MVGDSLFVANMRIKTLYAGTVETLDIIDRGVRTRGQGPGTELARETTDLAASATLMLHPGLETSDMGDQPEKNK
jgi:hypothetical protein